MKLILARHGETDGNVAEVFRGRLDIELNETGRKQARLMADSLAESKISAVFSSPLKRALETAQIVAARLGLKVSPAPELVDMDFGDWQGLSIKTVRDEYPELFARWLENPHHVKAPGGESLLDVRERTLSLVSRVTARGEGDTLMVSHRVVNKVLICALLGLDDSHFWNIKLDTCGLSVFEIENGRFVLTGHNDTSFLKSLRKAPLADF
ncbi:MAG: histidine phosphatase family protein [Chloroflexota bacterium]